MNRINLIINILYKFVLLYLLLVLIFFLFRIILLISFFDFSTFYLSISDVIAIFFSSLRYDSVAIFFAFIPLILLILLTLFTPYKQLTKYTQFLNATLKKYGFFVSILFLIISSFDYFFFKTYREHFSPIIVGLKDDKTSAILLSFWTDYPIIKVILLWFIFGFILYKIVSKITSISTNFSIKSKTISITTIILFIGFYFIGMRGFSFEPHPLDLRNASVTANQQLNLIPINGVFALKEALSEGNKYTISTNWKKTLSDNGFDSIDEALQTYLVDSYKDSIPINEQLFTKTSKNKFLEETPPNVVFILMESLSKHLFENHSTDCNLLGSLENQLDYCLVYKNILSAENLTIHTLENIVTGTPFTPISQSPYNNISLSTSIIKPFKKANYQSTFLFGGLYGWRNVGHYLKIQGFDQLITQKLLEKEYPNAAKFAWGIHDEYLYDKIFKTLNSSSNPQFIFTLTVSNHTPYTLPDNYAPKPIKIPDNQYNKMRMDKQLVDRSYRSFQYANHQLGLFIKKIRESKLGENTIIAITGDHNLHQGFNYDESELFKSHSVPFILYIPDKYKTKNKINTNKFGSHKDIFPTLFNIALSDATYYNTGENLLEKKSNFSINAFTFAANEFGVVKKGQPTNYYEWVTNKHISLKKVESNKHLDSLHQKMNAYSAIMGYTIQKELQQSKQ